MSKEGKVSTGKASKGDLPRGRILGESAVVIDLLGMIKRVAAAKTNILIFGESGTGKELVARLIHDSGPLHGESFVPVNCGAIPENLMESEFFGHRRGSFTGAVAEKEGLFQAADGGTLFLDEVGEIPLGLQVKLLRVLQEKSFKKVGGTDDIKVDVRIIAATNRDLEQAVAQGTFREDLYYRLNVIQLKTPPLRDREGDIELLCNAFLIKFAAKVGRAELKLSPEALDAIKKYPWPGNVRELENTIERAVTLENSEVVTLESLSDSVREFQANPGGSRSESAPSVDLLKPSFAKGPVHLTRLTAELETLWVKAALAQTKGDMAQAAKLLNADVSLVKKRK